MSFVVNALQVTQLVARQVLKWMFSLENQPRYFGKSVLLILECSYSFDNTIVDISQKYSVGIKVVNSSIRNVMGQTFLQVLGY